MESEDKSLSHSRSLTLRKLRTKIRKTQPSALAASTMSKRKKSESQINKSLKPSLKKKKKGVVKKISNQIDFNNYKKIFSNTFSKFDSNNSASQFKSNFHSFYNHVKHSTENRKRSAPYEEEKNNDMSNFFKTGKEYTNLKTLEKTQKVFDSAMDLLNKDPAFLDNLDVTKISNNVVDLKIKLDQCRKVIQKYNLNKELYTGTSQKDENIEQQVFVKRMKMYEGLKHNSNLSFDDIIYDPEFSGKESLELNDKSKEDSVLNDDFIKAANAILEQNMQIEDDFIEELKESQLDYILKIKKRKDIDAFLKENKSLAASVDLSILGATDNEEKGLGWKIFKNFIVESQETGPNTRKSLDIIGTKERFRTQKKNSDFLYYEPSSMKKSLPLEPETKKTVKDKHLPHKKKAPDSGSKATAQSSHLHHSAEKMSVDDHQSDSETQPSVVQRSARMEYEESKSLKMAESLIDDYREVLQHAFRNLSSKDANFVRQAVLQDGEIEKKTGISLNSLPQPHHIENLYHLDVNGLQSGDYILSMQTPPNRSDWTQQSKPVYTFTPPFNNPIIPGFVSNTVSVAPAPLPTTFFAVPVIVATPTQIISQPVAMKSAPSQILTPPTGNFLQIQPKGKMVGDLVIPDLKPSPQLKTYKGSSQPSQSQPNLNGSHFNLDSSAHMSAEKNENKGANISRNGPQAVSTGNFAKKDSILDQLINSEDGSNINYYSIFNSMDQGTDKAKGPIPYHMESLNDKSIKKNNIILTQNNFQNA